MVKQNLEKYDLAVLLRAFRISKSGYYAWLHRPESQRRQQQRHLVDHILEIHQSSRRTYGSPRIHAALKMRGLRASRHRVARIMRGAGLYGRQKRRHPSQRKASRMNLGWPDNLLNRDFYSHQPNQKWVTDITYLPTQEGWLYLAVVQDLFSRRIIGWAMETILETGLVVAALGMAQQTRKPGAGLLVHSDQGVQYRAAEFVQALSRLKAVQSMSRRGNCWDNAVCESFFATLKLELGLRQAIGSRAVTKGVVFEWIEVFYNRQRLHSSLGFLSPAVFE